MTKTNQDIAIIGGGIVGFSIAYAACQAGYRPTVFVREREGMATPAAAGILAIQAEATHLTVELMAFMTAANQGYPDFVAALSQVIGTTIDLRQDGTLYVALHRDHVAQLEHLAQAHARLKLAHTWLDRAAVRQRAPTLSPQVVGGLWLQEEAHLDPRQLLVSLRRAVLKLGGHLEDAAVTRLECDGETIRGLWCGERFFPATRVVIAAGSWSGQLLEGTVALPVRPVRGQILRFSNAPALSAVIRTPDVYLVPRANTELIVGATIEEVGFDCDSSAGNMYTLLRDARAVVPAIDECTFVASTVGFRPTLPDHLPAVGPTTIGGLYVATGHYRHGITLGPLTGKLLIDWIRSDACPPLLRPFHPNRFGPPNHQECSR